MYIPFPEANKNEADSKVMISVKYPWAVIKFKSCLL